MQYVSLISDDVAYVVYKNIFAKPNPKGNIFVAAFTTAHARLHLYDAVSKLDKRVLYMDTDSVVFTHKPGMWEPKLSSYLGDWTNEVSPGLKITEFTTCGPKNYSYTTKDITTGAVNSIVKVKGLSLTTQAVDMIDASVLKSQVDIFTSRKRPREEAFNLPAKRNCLVAQQKKAEIIHRAHLNKVFIEQGAEACLNSDMSKGTINGACNCRECVNKTSVTVPQVQFRKFRRDGYVETADIRKEYQIRLNKRWLPEDTFLTLPFGYKN